MRLYLGTHEPSWIGRSPLPLFVSLERARRFARKIRPAVNGWALDSGGFTRLHHGGWTTSADDYLAAVYRLADLRPGMEWAAPQDWMCEPSALEATGLTVEEHQRRTVANYLELRQIDTRSLVIPALQGWEPGEHERCLEMYFDAGVDLRDAGLVGVGSICRRQATSEIAGIVRSLAGEGLRLHGFGVKSSGLALYEQHLVSADSLAWSYRARKAKMHGEGALCGGTHAGCANCYEWAHEWHRRIVASPRQLDLFTSGR